MDSSEHPLVAAGLMTPETLARFKADEAFRSAAPGSACELHKSHAPQPTYCELHHVVPRDWQRAFTPAVAPSPGSYAGEKLWDAREVKICRTGHGNVHFALVAAMHALQDNYGKFPAATEINDSIKAAKKILHGRGIGIAMLEWETVRLGMTRFVQAGGELINLANAGIYGVI